MTGLDPNLPVECMYSRHTGSEPVTWALWKRASICEHANLTFLYLCERCFVRRISDHGTGMVRCGTCGVQEPIYASVIRIQRVDLKTVSYASLIEPE